MNAYLSKGRVSPPSYPVFAVFLFNPSLISFLLHLLYGRVLECRELGSTRDAGLLVLCFGGIRLKNSLPINLNFKKKFSDRMFICRILLNDLSQIFKFSNFFFIFMFHFAGREAQNTVEHL